MRVLLTGATGKIGGIILKNLHEAGHQIRVLHRSPLPLHLRTWIDDTHQGDILNPRDWRFALDGMEAVVHLAGMSYNHPDAFDVNVQSTRHLARYCAEAEVERIVFASSNCALGHCDRPANRPFAFDHFPIDGTHTLKPETDYGLSKYISEEVLRAASRRWGLQVHALRLSWVWSEAQCERHRNTPEKDVVHAPNLWSYLHEEDCARAFSLALQTEPAPGFRAFFVNAQDTFSSTPSQELLRAYYPLLASKANLNDHESFFDWRDALDAIGFVPTYSWRAAQEEEG